MPEAVLAPGARIECRRAEWLVGDQQQLAQPSQADHPGESGQSYLEYWMEGASVVPGDRGVFLSTSWRMEPSLTAMVSALFYEGRLQASPANGRNCITWAKPWQSSDGQLMQRSPACAWPGNNPGHPSATAPTRCSACR